MDSDSDHKWAEWLATRPDAVRRVAARIVPWKRWALKPNQDAASFYLPVSYEEHGGGRVSLTMTRCAPSGEPRWNVFGIQPDDVVEYPYGDNNRCPPDRIAAEACVAALVSEETE